ARRRSNSASEKVSCCFDPLCRVFRRSSSETLVGLFEVVVMVDSYVYEGTSGKLGQRCREEAQERSCIICNAVAFRLFVVRVTVKQCSCRFFRSHSSPV